MKSGDWEYWYPRKEETIDEDMPKLEDIFKKNNVSRILDFGCGTGRHAIYFAERGFDVYGFDRSPYAIQYSAEKLRERNLSANLIVYDMKKRLPYENEFFDAVIAVRVIHHARVKTIRHAISEIERITKKGGYFYVQVPPIERNLEYERMGVKGKNIEPGTRVPLEGPEKGIPHHGFTKEEILELLNGFNFEIKEFYERDKHYNILATKKH